MTKDFSRAPNAVLHPQVKDAIKKLADNYRIVFVPCDDGVFVVPPRGRKDPYEGDHFVSSWDDARKRVLSYAA